MKFKNEDLVEIGNLLKVRYWRKVKFEECKFFMNLGVIYGYSGWVCIFISKMRGLVNLLKYLRKDCFFKFRNLEIVRL